MAAVQTAMMGRMPYTLLHDAVSLVPANVDISTLVD
jgi:hypothetical protein